MPAKTTDSDASSEVQDEEDGSHIDCSSFHSRCREESTEEKRQRKQAVKAAQREARARKKQTKSLYRNESVRQQKQVAGMITKNASIVGL